MNVFAIVALAGSLASANIPAQPTWLKDYREARQTAIDGKKPLAVFIGSGVTGWEQVGKFDPKVYQLLNEKYVCVYVNTDTTTGKNLAKAFEVSGKGLVISDKAGTTQAFHHSGDLSGEMLQKALVRYSDTEVAQGTESVSYLAPTPKPTQYQSNCPSCPNYVPSFGGCPNGNCPR
jgi:hypothetical protein